MKTDEDNLLPDNVRAVEKPADYVNLPTHKQLTRNRIISAVATVCLFGAMGILAPHLILWTVVTLMIITFCVVIHEGGHYLTAKHYNMMVSEYAIGFGPILFYRENGGMIWSVRAVPAGGYVRIMGMTVEEAVEEKIADEDSFIYKKPYQRFIVGAAGVAVNIGFAFILMNIIRLYSRVINNVPFQLSDIWRVPYESVILMGNIVQMSLNGLIKLVTNFMGSEVGTVLMLPESLNQAATSPQMANIPPFILLLTVLTMLNMSLAVFNLLPLFPLDGGHLVLAATDQIRNMVAKIRQEKLPPPLTLDQIKWYRVTTMVVVFGMMLLMFGRDLWRIFT